MGEGVVREVIPPRVLVKMIGEVDNLIKREQHQIHRRFLEGKDASLR